VHTDSVTDGTYPALTTCAAAGWLSPFYVQIYAVCPPSPPWPIASPLPPPVAGVRWGGGGRGVREGIPPPPPCNCYVIEAVSGIFLPVLIH
jgi:hypothetical protein